VLDLKPRDHISCALRELHYLPISERIVYKLCLLVHRASLGQSPDYTERTNRKTADRAFSSVNITAHSIVGTDVTTQVNKIVRLLQLLFVNVYMKIIVTTMTDTGFQFLTH